MEVNQSIENLAYQKPRLITDNVMHYCPGCSHGTVHKLVAELIEQMEQENNVVAVSPVGCSVLAYNYIDIDWVQAAHGRAPAIATALKRLMPDRLVITYQGDGDLAAIGTAETIHSLVRGENIVIIFINNAIYGMTGGQMAPTTLIGQKTATTPHGRNETLNGFPYKMAEIAKMMPGVTYVTRQSVDKPASIRAAKKALKKAFENSLQCKGTSFVEIVATCSSGWKLNPVQSNEWMRENMYPEYPLGDLLDRSKNSENEK